MTMKDKTFGQVVEHLASRAAYILTVHNDGVAELDARWERVLQRLAALEMAHSTVLASTLGSPTRAELTALEARVAAVEAREPKANTGGFSLHANGCRLFTHIGGTCNCEAVTKALIAEMERTTAQALKDAKMRQAEPACSTCGKPRRPPNDEPQYCSNAFHIANPEPAREESSPMCECGHVRKWHTAGTGVCSFAFGSAQCCPCDGFTPAQSPAPVSEGEWTTLGELKPGDVFEVRGNSGEANESYGTCVRRTESGSTVRIVSAGYGICDFSPTIRVRRLRVLLPGEFAVKDDEATVVLIAEHFNFGILNEGECFNRARKILAALRERGK